MKIDLGKIVACLLISIVISSIILGMMFGEAASALFILTSLIVLYGIYFVGCVCAFLKGI